MTGRVRVLFFIGGRRQALRWHNEISGQNI